MTKLSCLAIVAVSVGLGHAAPTPQQNCDYARVTQWAKFSLCVGKVLAKEAKGVTFNHAVVLGKCRHKYFLQWTGFQANPLVAGSTCIGSRFTNNGNGTVTDNLSGLVWEQKTNDGTVRDWDNLYTWSTGAPYHETGSAFTGFLAAMNAGAGFGGANGWRLPTLAELQSIVLDFPCTGEFAYAGCFCQVPCIDGVFGLTQPGNFFYWSTAAYPPNALGVRGVNFNFHGHAPIPQKTQSGYVRAVRAGL